MWNKHPVPLKDPGLESSTLSEGSREKDVDFLHKSRRRNRPRDGHSLKAKTREKIKFRPLDDDDSTDSDTEAGRVSSGDARRINLRPWPPGTGSTPSTHSLTPTVLEEGVHSHVNGGKDPCQVIASARFLTDPEVSDLPDYSDYEVDITSDDKSIRHDADWTPRFLRNKAQLPRPQHNDLPITPPLDRALSRTGQREPLQKDSRDLVERDNSPRWQAFWRDVDEKIQHSL